MDAIKNYFRVNENMEKENEPYVLCEADVDHSTKGVIMALDNIMETIIDNMNGDPEEVIKAGPENFEVDKVVRFPVGQLDMKDVDTLLMATMTAILGLGSTLYAIEQHDPKSLSEKDKKFIFAIKMVQKGFAAIIGKNFKGFEALSLAEGFSVIRYLVDLANNGELTEEASLEVAEALIACSGLLMIAFEMFEEEGGAK